MILENETQEKLSLLFVFWSYPIISKSQSKNVIIAIWELVFQM